VSTTRELTFAQDLADIADAITMQHFKKHDLHVEMKSDRTPVSQADREVEEELRERIGQMFPDDAIVGEEYGRTAGAERSWIIDPIDGTKNYVRGVPVWATLIGLRVGDAVTLGVVSAPALGRRWWAESGGGAWVRDLTGQHRIRVSAITQLADASLSTSDPVGWPENMHQTLQAQVARSRAYGDFWSHMLVAEGAVDVALEPQLEAHDMAALIPIVEEAGGLMTGWRGGSALIEGSAMSTNGLLHNQVLSALNP
jgi:histidinol-phosphatase